MKGLIFGGTYILESLCTEGNLRFKIDWASLIVGRKFIVFALFYFVKLRAISKYKPPGGLYLELVWRGLYMEGFIFRILR